MTLILKQYQDDVAARKRKEQELGSLITELSQAINENEVLYKQMLSKGADEEADKLFDQQQGLKHKLASTTKKLQSLKPIHAELAREKFVEVLDNDLPELRDQFLPEAKALLKEEADLRERLQEINGERSRMEIRFGGEFSKYGWYFERLELKKHYGET